MSKIDHSLFSAHEHALEDAFGDCPDCGKPLHIKTANQALLLAAPVTQIATSASHYTISKPPY